MLANPILTCTGKRSRALYAFMIVWGMITQAIRGINKKPAIEDMGRTDLPNPGKTLTPSAMTVPTPPKCKTATTAEKIAMNIIKSPWKKSVQVTAHIPPMEV